MPYQNASFAQNLTFTLYNELYQDLDESTVGKRIKKQRMLKRLSQADLSKLSGILRSSINEYENSISYPPPDVLIKISKDLEKDLSYFFDDYYRFIFSYFGETILKWREKNKLTIYKMWKLTGFDTRTIKRWESGEIMERAQYQKLIELLKS